MLPFGAPGPSQLSQAYIIHTYTYIYTYIYHIYAGLQIRVRIFFIESGSGLNIYNQNPSKIQIIQLFCQYLLTQVNN